MADDSLLAHGFTSNFTPTPADLADIQRLARCGSLPSDPGRIRAIVSGAPADLEQYLAEIERVEQQQNMQQELRRLTLEHKTLASYAAFCCSLLSPAQRLPNELLVEIFDLCFPAKLYCMGVSGSSVDEVSRLTRRHLQRLAQVCFRWYRVALNTPKLWSTIVIHPDLWDNAPLDDTTLMNLLESSLERGKEHPLNIVVSLSPGNCSDSVLETLFRQAPRWREADIWSVGGPSDVLSRATNWKLDRLVSLSLDVGSWRDIKAFQHAPSLTELTFGREFDDLPILPWPQIKTVTYDSLSDDSPLHSALSVLRAAVNLVTCTLHFHLEGYDTDNEPWGTHATSRTRELYIRWMTSIGNDPILGRFLDSLTLPRLDVFDIRPDDGGVFPPLWSTNAFLGLAHRSEFQSTVTYLGLHVQVTDIGLLRCLGALSQLEQLVIRDCTPPAVTDYFLRGLQLHALPGSTPLVPNLGFLSIRCRLSFTDPVLVDLLASRRRVRGEDVFKMNLWWYATRRREVASETLERIAQLVSEGGLIFDSGAYDRAIHDGDKML
ncbi:hypothetical protein R3P38DRAFT_2638883 [Favolaschia claudopus]|uniref:F-box domain-containing protein n=1 Tax=Favolaschia claudopus TaxID=2862362 RepID=A0AAW0ALG1_9AGAR